MNSRKSLPDRIQKKSSKLKRRLAEKVFLRKSDYHFRNYFNPDCVAIFPEIGLCFNRVKKSGNSSICGYLAQISGYPQFGTPAELKSFLLRPETASIGQLKQARSYHSLVVVRNPFERSLSAFLDKVGGDRSQRFTQYAGHGDKSAVGFLKFLKHLDAMPQPGNRHFWPQTDLLYQPLEVFSLVAKLESLSSDLPPFLEKVTGQTFSGDTFRQPHQVEQAKEGKVTRAGQKILEYYCAESEQLVRKIYKRDFEELGYPETLPLD